MWILFTIIVLLLIWALGGFRSRRRAALDERESLAGGQLQNFEETSAATPLEVLQYRYASGEISQREYDEFRRELMV